MQLVIDLRSDTVTKPSPGMRQAMALAEVGDDVFGEDPTVQQLESAVARMLGKEAALFVPSGSMANQIAIRCHTEPGDEVIVESFGHSYAYEAAGMAAISGAQARPITAHHGLLDPKDVARAINPDNVHFGPSRLLMLENTSNRGGGTIYFPDRVAALTELAHRHGLAVHMDGARLWNAHVATQLPLTAFTRGCDSVSVCLSKGLGAPAGSLLSGTKALIAKARRIRKMLGGGMRQVGILAAAGLYALENNLSALANDHQKLRELLEGLATVEGLEVHTHERFPTNIAYIDLTPGPLDAHALVERLKKHGVLVNATGERQFRVVTHLDVEPSAVGPAVDRFRAAMTST